MKSAPKPGNEQERLAVLRELDILDTIEEDAYDDLTRIAATICNTPIALVSLVDEDRQWFKAHLGLEARETPRDVAFCSHAILDDGVFCVPDSEADERFHDNPLVTGEPEVRFYSGMPLTIRDDIRVGTLCVIDSKPRQLTDSQIQALEALGRQVTAQLILRMNNKNLKALDRLRTQFLAIVSHELRTPLTSIYGSLSILDSGVFRDNADRVAMLTKTALSNTERLRRIVNDVLNLTKLDAGRLEMKPQRYNLNATARTVVEDMASYFEQCQVKPVLELDDSLPECSYDEERIVQVIANLLSNAAKFSPEGSTVVLSTSVVADGIQLTVKDQGSGIPEELQANIFSQFTAIAPGRGKMPGTGLGLNISRKLIELHDGSIWFTTDSEKGTSFYFTLPIQN